MKEGYMDLEVEIEMQNDRPRRQMAIKARDRVKELYKDDLV